MINRRVSYSEEHTPTIIVLNGLTELVELSKILLHHLDKTIFVIQHSGLHLSNKI